MSVVPDEKRFDGIRSNCGDLYRSYGGQCKSGPLNGLLKRHCAGDVERFHACLPLDPIFIGRVFVLHVLVYDFAINALGNDDAAQGTLEFRHQASDFGFFADMPQSGNNLF